MPTGIYKRIIGVNFFPERQCYQKGHSVSLSEETKRKISQSHKGKKHSEEQKKKISESHRGNKSHFWKGGIAYLPYSVDWTKTLKRSIRERDKYTCQICEKEPAVECHHIDYDKKNCNSNNLIILCNSCHQKTNFNRDYWIDYFKKILFGKNTERPNGEIRK